MENHDGTIVAESSYLLVHVVTRKLKKGTACNQRRPRSLLDWKTPGEFYYENMPKRAKRGSGNNRQDFTY